MTRLVVVVALAAALVSALMLPVRELSAQSASSAGLAGRISVSDSLPLRGAVVRATQGPRTLEARSAEDGEYRISNMTVGTWVISVRRVGYTPQLDTIELPPEGLRRDFRLVPIATVLDPVLVASRWVGVRGIVVDARDQRPLDGASIQFTGARVARMQSDSLGRFSMERLGGTDAVVRVKRAGYASRIVATRVPRDGYAQVEIALDTLSEPRSLVVEGDLDSRLRWASSTAGMVNGEEIAQSDAKDFLSALRESPTLRRKGIHIPQHVPCIYVNGFPAPNHPLHAMSMQDVELVEVFPYGTEFSETLARRAAKGSVCAWSIRRARMFPRAGEAQYVSIWTRDRR